MRLNELQVAQGRVDDEHDVGAAAAVAAVGPALGHVRLPAERDDAVAAGTAGDEDPCFVLEHPRSVERRAEMLGGEGYSAEAGRTEMTRPLRLVLKSTTPGRVAKTVWSRPRPVPSPG